MQYIYDYGTVVHQYNKQHFLRTQKSYVEFSSYILNFCLTHILDDKYSTQNITQNIRKLETSKYVIYSRVE